MKVKEAELRETLKECGMATASNRDRVGLDKLLDKANSLPGLADMHIHLFGDTTAASTENALRLFLANGVTTVSRMSAGVRSRASAIRLSRCTVRPVRPFSIWLKVAGLTSRARARPRRVSPFDVRAVRTCAPRAASAVRWPFVVAMPTSLPGI